MWQEIYSGKKIRKQNSSGSIIDNSTGNKKINIFHFPHIKQDNISLLPHISNTILSTKAFPILIFFLFP